MRLLRSPGVVLVLLLLTIGAVAGIVVRRGPVVETIAASRTDLEQHVIANGRVRVVTRVQISAQISARVVSVRVAEGQRVRTGDLLVQMDDAEARAAVSQMKAALSQASGRLEQLRKVGSIVASEATRQTATNLERAQAELNRLEALAAAGLAAPMELEEARRSVEIARAQKNAAEAQETAAAPQGVESGIAMNAVLESQAQLAGAMARLDQTRILAPRDGIILSRSVEPGYIVQPGNTLFELAADGETQLVIEPDERNLTWIQLGQKARASADAYPQEIFDAVVRYIAPAIDPQRGSIEVRLSVPDPPAFLKPDMTVSVDLTVAAKSQALTVPSEAVRGAATADPWVFTVENGRTARRNVTLGIRGEGHTEIESGLSDGAEVVVSTDLTLVDGQRVRAVREDR
jgi:HlyD family secretion protein